LKYKANAKSIVKFLVTGGTGFLGSHLVDRLLEDQNQVVSVDSFITSSRTVLSEQLHELPRQNPSRFRLLRADVNRLDGVASEFEGVDVVCHLAANADVRGGIRDPTLDVKQNLLGTMNVLEAMRRFDVPTLIFSSSAVIYGEPTVVPTPESYRGPQTSSYGASKLAAEALIEAYSCYYGFEALVFRLVSLIGERYTHGVVFDFVQKLQADPRILEILGDGHQRKSYLYVKDAVAGMTLALERARPNGGKVEAFNLGHHETLEATQVANIVCREMGISGASYRFTGGSRGWVGDAPLVLLDTQRIRSLGWAPTVSVETAISRTVRYLLEHPHALQERSAGGPLPPRLMSTHRESEKPPLTPAYPL
jgi:UDP-glucose 4-epimerase